jgi:putative colanic acid biosynthesis UDP-glucose lipid carrier transferase
MISDRRRGIQDLVLLSQCVLVTLAFWLWLPLCYNLPFDHAVFNRYLIYNAFVVLGLVLGSRTLRTDVGLRVPGLEETSRRSFRQLGATLFYFLLYLVAAHDAHISRLFFFSFLPWLFLVLFTANRYLPGLIGGLTFRKGVEQKVVLVGPRPKALEVKRWLDENRHLGLEVQGLLTEDSPNGEKEFVPTLGKPDDLGKVLAAPGITQVIMAEFPRGNGSMRHYTDLCESRGSRLLVVADLDKIFGHPVAVFEDQGKFFLGLREEPLEDPINRFFKRCLDVSVSVLVLVLIFPVCASIVWLLQRLQSPGPLLYRQSRPGIQNRTFRIYKFRTLHMGNPDVDRLPEPDDPRVYPAGRFLRKYSVDEIPQFLNVLRGEMSIVGPRPHLITDNERFPRLFQKAYVRSFVKPGITGLAQARGFRGIAKTPEAVAHRIESDIEYLENWSFWLDCWLILRTATQMIVPPKGAM